MVGREPLNILHDRERAQKRRKTGLSMDTTKVLNDAGVANCSTGNYNGAETCFSQALVALGYDNILSTIQCIEQRSIGHHVKLEYNEGMYVYKSMLDIQDSTTAEEVAVVLLYNIAQTHVKRKLYKNAITWFHKSIQMLTSFPGAKPTSIVMMLHCLGYCFYRIGHDEKAKECYQKALATASVNQLATMHLAASLNCIGVIYFNDQSQLSHNTDRAMNMFTKSLALYKACDDIDAVAIATVLNNIGRVHYLRSDFDEACSIYEQCLEQRRQCLGHQSIDVAATSYNLGQTCYQLERLDDSLVYYNEFLRIVELVAGPISKDIALVYKGIGDIYQDKLDTKMAFQYFHKALDMQRTCSKGLPSTDSAATLNKLGNLCYEMKDFQSAMVYYREGLEIEKAVLAPNHPHIIITTTNMAHIFKQLKQHNKALQVYRQVLHMQQQQFGQNSFALAETMSSIGLMQYHLKQYEQAFESYQEALRIRRQHLGSDDHPEIASTLNSIGLVLFKQEIFDLAKNCFTESLRIRSKLLGKDHRDVAILWYNIATIHFENGEDELAIQMYKETLRVERHALGEDHPDVVTTLQHLGQVHQQLGYSEKAIGYFQEALDIERRQIEPDQQSLAKVLNLLGNVYLQLGRTREMMGCYEEAARIFESNHDFGETLVIGGYNFYGMSKTNPPCAPAA